QRSPTGDDTVLVQTTLTGVEARTTPRLFLRLAARRLVVDTCRTKVLRMRPSGACRLNPDDPSRPRHHLFLLTSATITCSRHRNVYRCCWPAGIPSAPRRHTPIRGPTRPSGRARSQGEGHSPRKPR